MNRRNALSAVAVLIGGVVVGGDVFISGCKSPVKKKKGLPLSNEQIAFLDEVAETIIPASDTPGAKSARVGAFMNVMVTDCYNEEDQEIFLEGITKLDASSSAIFNKTFVALDRLQKYDLLVAIDKEQASYMKEKKNDDPSHYFRLMKELTLLGFFTSEEGATKALRYVAVPGRYEACITYHKGDRAWAT